MVLKQVPCKLHLTLKPSEWHSTITRAGLYIQQRRKIYLQLSESESTTGTDTAVVLDSRATHNGTQLVNRTRGNSGGLRKTGLTTAVLAARLQNRKLLDNHGSSPRRPEHVVQNMIRESIVSISYLVEVHAHTTLPVLAEVYNELVSSLSHRTENSIPSQKMPKTRSLQVHSRWLRIWLLCLIAYTTKIHQ